MIEVSTSSTGGAAGWVLFGGLITTGFATVAARSNSVGFGIVMGSITAGWVLAAWWQWRREENTHPVPATEYFAAVWALAYISLLTMTATQRSYNLGDAMFLFPPVSLLPLITRKVLGDSGNPCGRARSAAYQLHRVCGWMLAALGGLFVVSLYFIFVAPLSLIPGTLNLYAASRYRLARSNEIPTTAESSVTEHH